MLWEPPTEQEKHIMKEFRDVFTGIVKADGPGLLYVRDIRGKIRRARAEISGVQGAGVIDYLLENYGIKLIQADDGTGLLPVYEIVDEQKYLIFMMKF